MHTPFTWMSSSSESTNELEDDIVPLLSDGVSDLLTLSSDSDFDMATPEDVLLKRKGNTAAALIKLQTKMPNKHTSKEMTMEMMIEEAKEQKQEQEEKKKSEIVTKIERKPSVLCILRKIVEMPWFLPKKLTINISSVTNALVALLDKVSDSIHGEICKCLVDINSELGFNDFLMDKVINNLLSQIHDHPVTIKCNAIKTLADLGDNRMKVVMGILPATIDPVLEVKREAVSALKMLNGLTSKDDLLNYLTSIGMFKPYKNQDRKIVKKIVNQGLRPKLKMFSKYIDHRKLPKGVADLQPPANKVEKWLAASVDVAHLQSDDSHGDKKVKKKKTGKDSRNYPEVIPVEVITPIEFEDFEDQQFMKSKKNSYKEEPKPNRRVKKLPTIKERGTAVKTFVPDSCSGVEKAHVKAALTERRKTIHAEMLEAKKQSLHLEKMKMEASMHQHMEIHRRNYEKLMQKQRKGKRVLKLLPTNYMFYQKYFKNAFKVKEKHEYPKQQHIAKCASLPRINKQEESTSCFDINCQFSVVLDKGSQKYLDVESGIEDARTCSKLSLSGGQKVGTQYSSGLFSAQELTLKQVKQITKPVVKNNSELGKLSSCCDINCQFSVVLDKGSHKYLDVESGIEDTLTCSKLSPSGGQKVGTQNRSGLFSTQELPPKQVKQITKPVVKNDSKLGKPTKLYLTSSVLQRLRKKPLPAIAPPLTSGQRVVYAAAKIPKESSIFPLRMTNKIEFNKESRDYTVANWNIKRSEGKSAFGVLELSWSLACSKEDVIKPSKKTDQGTLKQQKPASLRAIT